MKDWLPTAHISQYWLDLTLLIFHYLDLYDIIEIIHWLDAENVASELRVLFKYE